MDTKTKGSKKLFAGFNEQALLKGRDLARNPEISMPYSISPGPMAIRRDLTFISRKAFGAISSGLKAINILSRLTPSNRIIPIV
jgi:hypothetical protein